MISSEGLGSSQNSTSTNMSDASSNFQDKEPYKPEFMKYLESLFKIIIYLKTMHSTNVF